MKAALRAAFPASAAPVGAAYRACRPDPARSAPPSSRWLRAGLLAGRVPARRRTSTRPALRPPPPNSPDSSTARTCCENPETHDAQTIRRQQSASGFLHVPNLVDCYCSGNSSQNCRPYPSSRPLQWQSRPARIPQSTTTTKRLARLNLPLMSTTRGTVFREEVLGGQTTPRKPERRQCSSIRQISHWLIGSLVCCVETTPARLARKAPS